ncbi:hypothetical protein Trydic_g6835 [Trypoxylus dichotomus]
MNVPTCLGKMEHGIHFGAQYRRRWKRSQRQLKEGALVLVKENHTPPNDWKLGRVLSLTKGRDGVARPATIKNRNGIFKRNFSKICPLPVEVSSENTDECNADK